jgi:hypothetical protein
MRKKHGKTSVRVVEKCPDIPVALVQYTFTHYNTHNDTENTARNIHNNKNNQVNKRTLHNNKKYITIKIHNNKNTHKMINNVTKRIIFGVMTLCSLVVDADV